MKLHTKIITFLLHSLSIVQISCSSDELHVSKILRDGDTLVSAARSFELGFFSPTSTSRNRYLGIWFKNISSRTVVWVANRDSPVSAGTLNLDRSGNLVIVDGANNLTVWSTNTSSENNPVLRLLDTGNLVLVLREEASDSVTWQSFDHLTDTFTPSMHLGWDLPTRHQNYLSSWRSDADPVPGEFTLSLDASGYPQLVIRRKDSLRYRIGPFNGVGFSGMPRLNPNTASSGALIINDSAVHYEWLDVDEYSSLVTRVTLSPGGVGRVMMWVDPGKYWTVYYKFPADMCDGYAVCGPHAACDSDGFPVCGCLERFVPRDEESWRRSDWSRGCVRRTLLTCREEDVFLKYSGIKMPDARFTRSNKSASLKECEAMCLGNCSCSGYSDLDIRNGGSGCLMWFGDLVDIKRLPGEEQVIYVRMSASESGSKGVKRTTVVVIVVLASSAVLLLLLGLILSVIRKTTDRKLEDNNDEEMELPMYDLSTVFKATDGFSVSNKLGEGGFGPVYKGILADGKEIAVKRLSETSSQGLEEFKNEVLCIAKLQHRNLVKLLGWCIEGEEKMLIYEYMPNKSLDLILFDEVAKKDLDCAKRLRIINGVARGLLYLHQDSCLRVIHRDLKASNVLLDNDLNPKISDFGMARIFEGNETGGKTRRVVGTYGYMPPEYAVDGFFSLKSDVYSFGVLVLEIVSGHTNRGFEHTDHHHNLVGHAWILYKDGRLMELVDPMIIDDSLCLYELLRSIHVALLCVQRRPEDRPSMSTVVLMLGSGGVLPEAKEPGFFTERHGLVVSGSNEYTVTQIEAR